LKKISLAKIFLWAGAGVIAGYLVWWLMPQWLGKKEDPRSQDYLSRIAAEINRSVPVMIDKETELMPVVGAPGMLIYNYRLVGYSVAQLNHQKFAAGAKLRVTQGACERPETRDEFLKKGVMLRYSYFDKDKQHIATIDVTPADCGFN
jgi:hypothetical protein